MAARSKTKDFSISQNSHKILKKTNEVRQPPITAAANIVHQARTFTPFRAKVNKTQEQIKTNPQCGGL